MLFETLPQIILQARIALYYKNLEDQEKIEEVGADDGLKTILISITFAVIHGVFEFVALYVEAKVYRQ